MAYSHCTAQGTKLAQYTLREHQWILTNAAVSKDSNFGFIMVVYEKFFFIF